MDSNQYEIFDRPLTSGQRVEIYEVNEDRVAVILDINESREGEGEKDENAAEKARKTPVSWINGIFLNICLFNMVHSTCSISAFPLFILYSIRPKLLILFWESNFL